MKHIIQHKLTDDKIKTVIEKAFDVYKVQYKNYNPKFTWKNANYGELEFTIGGSKLLGKINLKPGIIDLELDVPFIFKLFEGEALNIIKKEIKVWLDKAEKGLI